MYGVSSFTSEGQELQYKKVDAHPTRSARGTLRLRSTARFIELRNKRRALANACRRRSA
jgi:hypothetical protein